MMEKDLTLEQVASGILKKSLAAVQLLVGQDLLEDMKSKVSPDCLESLAAGYDAVGKCVRAGLLMPADITVYRCSHPEFSFDHEGVKFSGDLSARDPRNPFEFIKVAKAKERMVIGVRYEGNYILIKY